MKNFKNTLHRRKWFGVGSTKRGDKTEIPAHNGTTHDAQHQIYRLGRSRVFGSSPGLSLLR